MRYGRRIRLKVVEAGRSVRASRSTRYAHRPQSGIQPVVEGKVGLSDSSPHYYWYGLGDSVTGAAHHRAGVCNQDAMTWAPDTRSGPPLVLVVADGHGSPRCFRSDKGAEIAVDVAVAITHSFLQDKPTVAWARDAREERLPRSIVHHWQEEVEAHLRARPIEQTEWDRLIQAEGADGRAAIKANPLLAYGATLLVAAVTEEFALYLQLGDGDIVVVTDDGTVERPIAHDDRLIANETTSLCSPTAAGDIRSDVVQFTRSLPALILVSTDGYANSFQTQDGFLQVGSDMLKLMRARGPESIESKMTTWLSAASTAGSGDDITLGVIFRSDIVSIAS